jgi:hypothetical protein
MTKSSAPTKRMIARSLGKMPTTSVRRLISPFNRSSELVEFSCCRCSLGNQIPLVAWLARADHRVP